MSQLPEQLRLDGWLADSAIPFDLNVDATTCAAIDRLVAALGEPVELLGLGEALHGGEEILQFRNRLFQRLVTAHGFCAIAVESSFPRGFLVDDFVAGRGPDAYEEIEEAGFGHGFGKLTANRELLEWMREYNAGVGEHQRVAFYGFDIPGVAGGPVSPRDTLAVAVDHLAIVDPACAAARRATIDAALGEEARWQNPMLWRDPAAAPQLLEATATLRLATEDLISDLLVNRPALAAQSGVQSHLDAMQHAVVARQLLTFFVALATGPNYATSLGVRDAMMAENLVYVIRRERPRGKVLAFAHNKHLQRGRATWQLGADQLAWWPAGAHLAQMLGEGYAVVGSAVGVSEANGIGRPPPGTLEARLVATPGPARMTPLGRTSGGSDAPAAASRAEVAAALAALSERERNLVNPTYFPLDAESYANFDWLVTFDAVSYTRGGPPLPGAK